MLSGNKISFRHEIKEANNEKRIYEMNKISQIRFRNYFQQK